MHIDQIHVKAYQCYFSGAAALVELARGRNLATSRNSGHPWLSDFGTGFLDTHEDLSGLPSSLNSPSEALSIATLKSAGRFVVRKIEAVKDRPFDCPPL
jgi:hypothetical protein